MEVPNSGPKLWKFKILNWWADQNKYLRPPTHSTFNIIHKKTIWVIIKWWSHLPVFVYTNDTRGRFIRCHDNDWYITDSIHIDTRSSLQVVQMDVTILGNHINYVMFWADLHGHREIILLLRRKVHTNRSLFKWLVTSCRWSDLNDMQLQKNKQHWYHFRAIFDSVLVWWP